MMQSEGIETNSRPSLFLCLSHGRVSVRSFPPKISIYGTCSHMGNPHPRIHYAASLLSVKYSYATYYSLVMYDTHDSKPVVYVGTACIPTLTEIAVHIGEDREKTLFL